jgi:hypothetical protein
VAVQKIHMQAPDAYGTSSKDKPARRRSLLTEPGVGYRLAAE